MLKYITNTNNFNTNMNNFNTNMNNDNNNMNNNNNIKIIRAILNIIKVGTWNNIIKYDKYQKYIKIGLSIYCNETRLSAFELILTTL